MPSILRRINLTVPDEIYCAIKAYADENGIQANSVACMSLIQRALASYTDGQFYDICVIEKVFREYDCLVKKYDELERKFTGLYGLYSDILGHLRSM